MFSCPLLLIKCPFASRRQRQRLSMLMCVALSSALACGEEVSNIFALPPPGDAVVGQLGSVVVGGHETLVDVSRANKHGFDAMVAANAGIDPWVPEHGAEVVLPGLHVLPDAPRQGIVVNVAEKRLYYYPRDKHGRVSSVEVYAVSVGRGDWQTPLRTTRVVAKVKNPAWYPPESVRAEHAARGDMLPTVVPPGPDNPLGQYVIKLTLPSYYIHGTNRENDIGMQVTHGCIRMYPADIERLANAVPKGTPVTIINQPYKAGWKDGVLYLEVHPSLDGAGGKADLSARSLSNTLARSRKGNPDVAIHWGEVWRVRATEQGIPLAVGERQQI